MKNIIYTAVAAIALSTTASLAFDDQDRAAVGATFETLTKGIADNDYEAVFSTMSPALLAKMAEPTGMPPEAFQELMATQMKAAMEQVEIKSVTYDLDGMTTGTSEADRDYAVVSTTTEMSMSGANMKAVSPALAFEDDGKWYLLQVQSPDQQQLLAEVYPDLAEIELPAPEMTAE